MPDLPERYDRRVFEQDEGVGYLAGNAPVSEVGLQVEGRLIVHQAKIQYLRLPFISGGLFLFGYHA